MVKATKGHIIFYKGIVLEKIHDKLVSDGTTISTGELDTLLKDYAGYDIDTSVSDMTREELNTLVEWSKQFAMQIGLDLDKCKDINFEW